jgi:nicotinamidase/pyrazinamidase
MQKIMKPQDNAALILVDIQKDFSSTGALPTQNGEAVVPIVNGLMDHFELVVATKDWHPEVHGSFAANHPGHEVGDVIELDGLEQVLWPVHCVQDSPGAAFIDGLRTAPIEEVFKKGLDPKIDSYSGFFDNGHRRPTGLNAFLQNKDVDTVFIAGLATDVCVKFTALDAVKLSYDTHVIIDACRGVAGEQNDEENAIQQMKNAGVTILQSSEVEQQTTA